MFQQENLSVYWFIVYYSLVVFLLDHINNCKIYKPTSLLVENLMHLFYLYWTTFYPIYPFLLNSPDSPPLLSPNLINNSSLLLLSSSLDFQKDFLLIQLPLVPRLSLVTPPFGAPFEVLFCWSINKKSIHTQGRLVSVLQLLLPDKIVLSPS